MCPWYKSPQKCKKGKKDNTIVTRKDRMHYVIHKKIMPSYIENTLGIQLDEVIERLFNIINKLSSYTHINESTFPSSSTDNSIAHDMLMAFYMFLALTEKTKQSIIVQFENKIETIVDDTFLSDIFLDDLYLMATHAYFEGLWSLDIDLYELLQQSNAA